MELKVELEEQISVLLVVAEQTSQMSENVETGFLLGYQFELRCIQ